MIVGYTKLYSHKKKRDISFEYTNEKICLFLVMLPLSRYYKLPDHTLYYETNPDTFI